MHLSWGSYVLTIKVMRAMSSPSMLSSTYPVHCCTLSLTLILTIMVGCLYAQVPQSSSELAPAPTAPGPLDTLPSLRTNCWPQLLTQFNWLEREVPSNPSLESLLSLRAPRGLAVSTSLTEEGSDNFDHTPGSHRVDSRTGVVLGTVYRLDDGQNFVSLAIIRASYQARTARS